MKEELGLDHFEGHSSRGLHRHALMTMIAYALFQRRRLQQAMGEKAYGRDHHGRHASCPQGCPQGDDRGGGTTNLPPLSKDHLEAANLMLPK